MDILQFQEQAAQSSLELAMLNDWKFHHSLARYLASFSEDPETSYEWLSELIAVATAFAWGRGFDLPLEFFNDFVTNIGKEGRMSK